MRRRSSILIRAEDHLGDSLGAVFILEPENYGDTVIDKLREYLGEQTHVIKAEVSREKIEVEVECTSFRAESDRLVDSARGLRKNRLYRSAAASLKEALKLDPLNPHALIAMGEVQQDGEAFGDAIAMLIRAREVAGGDSPQLLTALGACCLKVERTASAIRYFEGALALDPRHVGARRALLALGRRPTLTASKREPEETAAAPRKPQKQQ
jgi:tetratricopeptide (TPR) repeat protein